MKTWKSISAVVAVLAIIALGYLPFGSAAEEKSIGQMITEAKTSTDHGALAAFYKKEAQEACQKQAEHQKMSDLYAQNPSAENESRGGCPLQFRRQEVRRDRQGV